jgi:DNA-binding CsgD family transcriptional regulator
VAAPPAWLPLTTRLEQAFVGRVSVLPTVTRTLLLVAAVDDGEELAVILAAAARVAGGPITLDDLTPALVARLVESDGRTARFRHPLMRTAIRQRSSLAQRHAVHAALADVLVDEPDRRVLHRAAACIGTDDEVATELEAVATRAQRRGAVAAAVAALERAADLSAKPDRRSERLLRAAELAFELGGHQRVARLLDDAARIDAPVQRQTQITWIRDSFDEGLTDVAEGTRTLTDAAERVAGEGNTDLAMKFLSGAALRCWWADPPASPGEHVAAVAERIDMDEGDPRLLFVLAFAAPLSRGAVVLDRLRLSAGRDVRSAHEFRLLGNAATAVGDFELASVLLADSVADLRAQGRVGLLARALTLQSWSASQIADLRLAGPVAAEAARLAHETSQPVVHATARATQALVAALCGGDVEHFALQAEQVARPVGAKAVLAAVQIARGAAALAHGHHAAAWDHLRRLHDPVDPAHHRTISTFALGDLAEAAVHSGHVADARALMEEMEELLLRTPSPALHVGVRHARALLADDADADRRYEEARAGELRRWPFAQARVQLAHGAWLRRHRRVAESRPLLRSAAETFDALGTVPWGDRARQELRASGERNRRRTVAGQHQLTPQELQIVQLAAAGLTNREIGEQLYLSHRTVSSHLHRVFPKLGVTSRAMLGDALSGP